jgi:hypothetical protein
LQADKAYQKEENQSKPSKIIAMTIQILAQK